MRFFLTALLSLALTGISAADYEYTLRALSPNAHTYEVEVVVTPQSGEFTLLKIPSWRPGRYYEQDFAAAISFFSATDHHDESLNWEKVDKDTWKVWHRGTPTKIKATYRAYANNMDSGSSYYDEDHYYFNPVNIFMYVPGRFNGNVRLHLPDVPADWKLASALTRSEDGKYLTADTYHEFADSPTILAKDMIQTSFEDEGTTFYLHFHGDVIDGSDETIAAVAEMVKVIAQEESAIFGGYPFDEFHFLYRFLPYQLGHGVEHEFSTVISVGASVTDTKDRFVRRLQSLTAHELWHAWNVKRLRPAAMWPYDYGTPQYTNLHWFTEGVTDYYTKLILHRAGLADEEQYFNMVSGVISSMENNYASQVVSPSMSSMNSWLVRSDYKDPDHGISYYTQGSWIGLLIELELRARTDNEVSFDDVFRYLWDRYYLQDEGVPEDGIQDALETLSGSSWDQFFDDHVHGVEPVDYDGVFNQVGLELTVTDQENPGARGLGIIQYDNLSQGILIRKINPAGDAFLGGLGQDMLIMEIDGQSPESIDLDDYINELRPGKKIEMKVLKNFSTLDEVTVTYEGRSVPRSYELGKSRRINRKQAELIEDWLAPKRE